MAETDYEVDENGKERKHKWTLSVNDFNDFNTRGKASALQNRQNRTNKSRAETAETEQVDKGDGIGQIKCPDCYKYYLAKTFKRHQKEKHLESSPAFTCNICSRSFKRGGLLKDHQRRVHLEPIPLRRPKKMKHASENEVRSRLILSRIDMVFH